MLLVCSLTLTYELIFFFKNHCTFLSEGGVDCSAEFDVSLHLVKREWWLKSIILKTVHVYNVLRNVVVFIVIFVVKHQEEDIESRHDWGRDLHVESQRFCSIVSTVLGVGSGQDRGSSIQGCVDTSLSERDGLLLHCLMDSYLILGLHFVKLIYATDAMVCKHECTGLDTEIASLWVFDDTSCQTSGTG